jgi:hypothetical protein
MWTSRMGQCVFAPSLVARPGLLTVRMQAPTSVYGQAQAFPARLFLSSLCGRWLPNWVAPLGSGIEHLSNEVVLYRRSNKFADKFTRV